MRWTFFLSVMLSTAVLCVSGIGPADAEPHKNQILVKASCDNGQSDNGQNYRFVINAMSKTGHVLGSTDNVVVKQYTVKYYDQDGNLVGGDEYESGNKKGLQGDLIICRGETTTELQGLGLVTAMYDFQAFVTPRGKA